MGNALSASLFGDSAESRLAGITTADADAYDLYLQARKARSTYSYGGLQEAEDLLKGALLIDPEFADAKIELASSYVHQLETGLMDRRTALAEIVATSDQALAERPGLRRRGQLQRRTGGRDAVARGTARRPGCQGAVHLRESTIPGSPG